MEYELIWGRQWLPHTWKPHVIRNSCAPVKPPVLNRSMINSCKQFWIEMSVWQCILLLNFCLVLHCKLIKRLILCYRQELNKNNIEGKRSKWLWLQKFIYLFLEILLNQIKPTVLGHKSKHKIERYSGEKLHSYQSLLHWAVEMW